jgi:hypothetical protein
MPKTASQRLARALRGELLGMLEKDTAHSVIMWTLESLDAMHHFMHTSDPVPLKVHRALKMRLRAILPRILRALRDRQEITRDVCFPPVKERPIEYYMWTPMETAGLPNEMIGKGSNGSGLREAISRVIDRNY